MPAKGSQEFAAWTARRKTVEDERIAAGAATDQLAADLKAHIANRADTAAQAGTANGWAFFASLICFVMVAAASYIFTGRLNRS